MVTRNRSRHIYIETRIGQTVKAGYRYLPNLTFVIKLLALLSLYMAGIKLNQIAGKSVLYDTM